MNIDIGIKGRIRAVVSKSNGEVCSDTGEFDNLILNQGLDVLGGIANKGNNLYDKCVIGTGTSIPNENQTSLDTYVSSASVSNNYNAVTKIDAEKNIVIVSRMFIYKFENIGNYNLTEIGLASTGFNESNVHMCTRTLFKDSSGESTTISLQADETLSIYYTIYAVYSTLDRTGTINLLDGNGGSTPYNYLVRLSGVSTTNTYWGNGMVGTGLTSSNVGCTSYSSGAVAFTEIPVTKTHTIYDGGFKTSAYGYLPGSYTRTYSCSAAVGKNTGLVKTMYVGSPFSNWQIEYSKVSDGSGITVTSSDKISTTFTFNWGRYDGEID